MSQERIELFALKDAGLVECLHVIGIKKLITYMASST